MNNCSVRNAAKEHGVKLWEIADDIGMNDGNLSRKLRHELPNDEQEKIVSIIISIADRKKGGTECLRA